VFHERLKQLGDKYLLRTGDEFEVLQQAVAQGRAGDVAAIAEVRNLAHRICGSSAMLGFKSISDVAGKIEAVVRNAEQLAASDWADITTLLQQLDTELQHARQQRHTDQT
jgi:HPt (histidine-containing phosphotransfer) domain-containing protein